MICSYKKKKLELVPFVVFGRRKQFFSWFIFEFSSHTTTTTTTTTTASGNIKVDNGAVLLCTPLWIPLSTTRAQFSLALKDFSYLIFFFFFNFRTNYR